MTPLLPAPLALVCHDFGATRLILPWLGPDARGVRAHLQGPAIALWRQHFGDRALLPSVDLALEGARWLLSGTSLTAELEHRARIEATLRGMRTVAVIDHWVHYAARFQRDGVRLLPDEIWVCDAEAYALAQARFPGHPLRLQPNTWLRAQVERMAPCPDPRLQTTVLVLIEPLGQRWGGAIPGEEQALAFLLSQAHRLGLKPPLSLRLRPHASDPPDRWEAWIQAHQDRVEATIDRSPTWSEAMDDVAWVAGFESTALVVALATGRRAVCIQPPWVPRARLPQRGLIHLRDLLPADPPLVWRPGSGADARSSGG